MIRVALVTSARSSFGLHPGRAAAFVEHVGLEVLERSPEEHDEAMAYMQALPFFIARALVALDLPHDEDILSIPSFAKRASIAEIEKHHTDEMFDTSQRANPYAEVVRNQFLEALRSLDEKIRSADPLQTELQL